MTKGDALTDGAPQAEPEKSGEEIKPAAPKPAEQSLINVRLVDGKTPFPDLAYFKLSAAPRPGDCISVNTSTGRATYRVDFVNFNPFDAFQIIAGCSFVSIVQDKPGIASADMKQRMDDLIKANMQFFERGQAYSTAIMVAGYAGVFGLLAYSKDQLSHKAVDVISLSLAFSILLYIGWEIFGMLLRSCAANRFQKLISESPNRFFELLPQYDEVSRRVAGKVTVAWHIVLWPTILTGFFAGLLLIYNLLAHLIGFAEWP